MKRIRDYGYEIGSFTTGPRNKITDVPGVRVGHVTLKEQGAQTGVSVVMPAPDNLFQNKLVASAHVVNGFGKSTGLVQIEELGTIETPIVLTNTLSVGDALKGLIEYKLLRNEDIGISTGTVNGLVCECNDAYLNTIRNFHVKPQHVLQAIDAVQVDFEEGAVGAGRGMSAYGMKGGIGSASRVIEIDGQAYTLGLMVLTNMGKKKDFILAGQPIGRKIIELDARDANLPDKGSIIMVVATDLPVTALQLKRICKRTVAGLSRTGSNMGHGSGEIVIGFSTANRLSHTSQGLQQIECIHDDSIDLAFEAVAEATEEAVLNSMVCAESVEGRAGNIRKSLAEYL